MLSQFVVNKMDEHLSSKPFKRHWWSRPWIVHMTGKPPLTRDYPLWKRNKDELRLLRLFGLTPEELGKKVERYWKKPRWRRWFASFGMNKKIDVWNYYQRCLAYQATRPNKLEQESFIVESKSEPILKGLSLVLHQSNIKFEAYLEKHCRNPKWIEKHFSKEISAYKQKIKKIFLSKLNKSLQQIRIERDRLIIKQQAEQKFQQVEAFMFHYHGLWLNSLFPRITPFNGRLEIGADVTQNGSLSQNIALSLAGNDGSQTLSPSSPVPRTAIYQTKITLHRSREWILKQREQLKLLLKEGSLQKVEELLQSGLNDIKMITELHLGFCDTMLSDAHDKEEGYPKFLNYLENLQRQLKLLLQGGMLLFHPDHVLNLIHSQEMKELITRHSQTYLEQSRCYLDNLKNYHLHIEAFYLFDQQKLKRQQLPSECSDLAKRIQELGQSFKELKQSFKEFAKELSEFKAELARDKADLEARLKALAVDSEAKLKALAVDSEAKLKALEAERAQNKADLETRLKALETRLSSDSSQHQGTSTPVPTLTENQAGSSNNVLFLNIN